jgi:GNAT superfamily N-acetyltransferase
MSTPASQNETAQQSKCGSSLTYRQAGPSDIPALARIRAISWSTEDYWRERIAGYLNCIVHPRDALEPRVIYVAETEAEVVGLIAGHLTRRLGCEGELEWIDVIPDQRRKRIASHMVRLLAEWFVQHGASRICVDPGNGPARTFYRTLAAQDLNAHWMFWPDIRLLVTNAETHSAD